MHVAGIFHHENQLLKLLNPSLRLRKTRICDSQIPDLLLQALSTCCRLLSGSGGVDGEEGVLLEESLLLFYSLEKSFKLSER